MGFFDKLANILGLKKKECNVLVVGLDNSGKSTILNHFKPADEKYHNIVPTVGFSVEKFKSKFCKFNIAALLQADSRQISSAGPSKS